MKQFISALVLTLASLINLNTALASDQSYQDTDIVASLITSSATRPYSTFTLLQDGTVFVDTSIIVEGSVHPISGNFIEKVPAKLLKRIMAEAKALQGVKLDKSKYQPGCTGGTLSQYSVFNGGEESIVGVLGGCGNKILPKNSSKRELALAFAKDLKKAIEDVRVK